MKDLQGSACTPTGTLVVTGETTSLDLGDQRLVHHPDSGTHDVGGDILQRWESLGGVSGFLGQPISNEGTAADRIGRFNHFRGGSIYWHPRAGAFEVHGKLHAKWASLGSERSSLGYPTSNERPAPAGGRIGWFQSGAIVWHSQHGAHVLGPEIVDRWLSLGGGQGRLGHATGDEQTDEAGSKTALFERGVIYWDERSGALSLSLPIFSGWKETGGVAGALGAPVADEKNFNDGGRFVRFAHGYLFWQPRTGVYSLREPIVGKWERGGGLDGSLGHPIGKTTTLAQGVTYARFVGGALLSHPSTGTYSMPNAMLRRWISAGGPAGTLGGPVDDARPVAQGSTSVAMQFTRATLRQGEGPEEFSLHQDPDSRCPIVAAETTLDRDLDGALDSPIEDIDQEMWIPLLHWLERAQQRKRFTRDSFTVEFWHRPTSSSTIDPTRFLPVRPGSLQARLQGLNGSFEREMTVIWRQPNAPGQPPHLSARLDFSDDPDLAGKVKGAIQSDGSIEMSWQHHLARARTPGPGVDPLAPKQSFADSIYSHPDDPMWQDGPSRWREIRTAELPRTLYYRRVGREPIFELIPTSFRLGFDGRAGIPSVHPTLLDRGGDSTSDERHVLARFGGLPYMHAEEHTAARKWIEEHESVPFAHLIYSPIIGRFQQPTGLLGAKAIQIDAVPLNEYLWLEWDFAIELWMTVLRNLSEPGGSITGGVLVELDVGSDRSKITHQVPVELHLDRLQADASVQAELLPVEPGQSPDRLLLGNPTDKVLHVGELSVFLLPAPTDRETSSQVHGASQGARGFVSEWDGQLDPMSSVELELSAPPEVDLDWDDALVEIRNVEVAPPAEGWEREIITQRETGHTSFDIQVRALNLGSDRDVPESFEEIRLRLQPLRSSIADPPDGHLTHGNDTWASRIYIGMEELWRITRDQDRTRLYRLTAQARHTDFDGLEQHMVLSVRFPSFRALLDERPESRYELLDANEALISTGLDRQHAAEQVAERSKAEETTYLRVHDDEDSDSTRR
ncbi:MAG: hypothetical protein AAF799_35445 [Myxococcota bacterium]